VKCQVNLEIASRTGRNFGLAIVRLLVTGGVKFLIARGTTGSPSRLTDLPGLATL
jgi:hypothetical protein